MGLGGDFWPVTSRLPGRWGLVEEFRKGILRGLGVVTRLLVVRELRYSHQAYPIVRD